MYRIPIGECKKVREGTDITIVSHSYMTLEALRAADILKGEGIFPEIIDLRTIKPIDWKTINKSVNKTGKLLVLDSAWKTAGIAAEIIASVAENGRVKLKKSPGRITFPDASTPTSCALTKFFYPGVKDIIKKVSEIVGVDSRKKKRLLSNVKSDIFHDVPDKTFTGPF